MTNRRWVGLGLKLIISISLVGYLLDAVGVEDAFDRLVKVDPSWLLAALGVAMVQIWICAVRWRVVLNAIEADLGIWPALRFWYIGAFFSQALPSSLGGDVVRGYLAYKNGLRLPVVLTSLFLDRTATVLALVLLVAGLTPFAAGGLEGGAWFQRAVWLVLAGALGGTAMLMVMDRLGHGWTRFRVVRALHYLAADTRRALLHPLNALLALGWSFAGHVNLTLVIYILFRGLGVELALIDCLVLFPPVLLAQTLPISVAGWGVREGAMVALFALASVPADAALAASLLFGLVFVVTSLPGAVVWLMSGRNVMAGADAFAAQTQNMSEK